MDRHSTCLETLAPKRSIAPTKKFWTSSPWSLTLACVPSVHPACLLITRGQLPLHPGCFAEVAWEDIVVPTSEEMLESLRNILGGGAVESMLSQLSEENQWKTNARAPYTQRKEKHLPSLLGEKKGSNQGQHRKGVWGRPHVKGIKKFSS